MAQTSKALMILWFQMLTLQSNETIKFVISSKNKINIHNNPQERNKTKQKTKNETKKNKTKWTICPCFKDLIILLYVLKKNHSWEILF